MITKRIVKELRLSLHDKEEYDWIKSHHRDQYESEEEMYDDCEFEVNVDDILRVYQTEDGTTAIQIANEDYQGGSHKTLLFENYEELRNIVINKRSLIQNLI